MERVRWVPWEEIGNVKELPDGIVASLVWISVQCKFGVIPKLCLEAGEDLGVRGHVEVCYGFAFPLGQFRLERDIVVLKYTEANSWISTMGKG